MLVLTILLATLVITIEAIAQEVNLTGLASGEKLLMVYLFVKNYYHGYKKWILIVNTVLFFELNRQYNLRRCGSQSF